MKISVIIPTMNDPEVFQAIDSAVAQDYDAKEVIVVDGSTGEHRTRLHAYCADQDTVRYVHEDDRDEDPIGLNGSRNLGCELATGEAIALLDGDCTAEPGWLAGLAAAFAEYDLVECRVKYAADGPRCPMDRTVENDGKHYRFLGAGLAFKKAVWEQTPFDERFFHLRNDTAFGLDALENGFEYGYTDDAVVLHHSGRFSAKQFVTERLRFVDEPLFFNEYRDHDHFEDNVSHMGPILAPNELAYLTVLCVALFLPIPYITVPGLMVASAALYVKREREKAELAFCPKDLAWLCFLVPAALIAKRYAIWKGAVTYKVPVL